MKATRNLLLFIGSAGMFAAFYGLVKGDPFMDQLMTIICSASLIYGYFQLKKEDISKC